MSLAFDDRREFPVLGDQKAMKEFVAADVAKTALQGATPRPRSRSRGLTDLRPSRSIVCTMLRRPLVAPRTRGSSMPRGPSVWR